MTHHEGPSSLGEIDQLACILARRREGFSTSTCLPASSAIPARRRWVEASVTIATASASGVVAASAASSVTLTGLRRDSIKAVRSAVADGDDAGMPNSPKMRNCSFPSTQLQ